MKGNVLLGELAPRLEQGGDDRAIGAQAGTSLAAPHVAHAAARALRTLEGALGRAPSANLVRALVGSSAQVPPCGSEWFPDEDDQLRMVGYGMPAVEALEWSRPNRVRLVAMDEVPEGSLHLYRMPIPAKFLEVAGRSGLVVSLAYDPPTRASRKEYLARTMWFEVFQGLTPDEIEYYKGRFVGDRPPRVPTWACLELRPSKLRRQWSTLQVGQKEWRRSPRWRVVEGNTEPVLHVLVGCQARFASGTPSSQAYGLVVGLWHESEEVSVYEQLRASLRVPASRVRVAVQG